MRNRNYLSLCLISTSIAISLSGMAARASQPELETISLSINNHTITFTRLKKHHNIQPLVKTKDEKTGEWIEHEKPFEVAASYLMQTELSLRDVKTLTSLETWNKYKALVLEYTGLDDDPKFGPYREAVRTAGSEFPACLVDAAMLVEISRSIEEKATDAKLNDTLNITKLTCRLPSKVEWQYAARAISTEDELQDTYLFPAWPAFDVKMRGRLVDILKKQKNAEPSGDEIDRSMTPEALVQLADQRITKKSNDGYKLLGDVLRTAKLMEGNIGKKTDQRFLPIKAPEPNRWGFHRMLGGVPEWTLACQTSARAGEIWQHITTNKDKWQLDAVPDATPTAIQMGGPSFLLYAGVGRWKSYSVAHGENLEGAPWPLKECVYFLSDGALEDAENFIDTKPGARLLITKELIDDWFVVFRRGMRQPNFTKQTADTFRNLFTDISSEQKGRQRNSLIEFYTRLASPDEPRDAEWWQFTSRSLLNGSKALKAKSPKKSDKPGEANQKPLNLKNLNSQTVDPLEALERARKRKKAREGGNELDFFQLLAEINEVEEVDNRVR